MFSRAQISPIDYLRSRRKTEGAFSIAEALIASVIIMIVLIATASGLSSSFRSSATIENNNKARQLANQVIAVAQQANYRDMYVATTNVDSSVTGANKCDPIASPGSPNPVAVPANTQWVANGENAPFKGLVYCQTKRFGGGDGVGTTFYIQTKIVFLKTGSAFDNDTGSDSNNYSGTVTNTTNNPYYAKRVYVNVRWQDVSSGADNSNLVKETYTRSPSASDCLPNTVLNTGKNTDGSLIPVPGCS